ncbi:delta-endotoxin CytB [Dendrothele bispora CBS 962.96]|uniref:Delta-endotoxin CytB n=1 Tax=Dendrothele bispora (strain CBS 962.96) TaxID=1314807 RepID=A0A4S8LBW3_DENBC|nr:delta-endotoxin CytB [Dendrothele bispora CBS 962.96]
MSGNTYFNECLTLLPSHLQPTGNQVTKFSSHYVRLEDPNQKYFDQNEFLEAVCNNNPAGDDLTFNQSQNVAIDQPEMTISIVADKIVEFLRQSLDAVLGDNEVAVWKKNIEDTFIDLKTAKDNGWAEFSNSDGGYSSWEYRVLFAAPNYDTPDSFYSCITIIRLTADIQEESSWSSLQSGTKKEFSASVDAMELVIGKDFKDSSD